MQTPAEAIYYTLLQRRRAKFSLAAVSVGVPVVSVGNLTVGGTGKTPCVQWIAQELQKSGRKAAIVSRGYGGSLSRTGAVVSNGSQTFLNATQAGDEPLLHARSLPGVAVVIGVDRVAAARRAVDECGAQIVVLDDGFGFWSLRRDLEIVLLDAARPFGNGRLLPTGTLREAPAELKRAGLVILTRCDSATPEQMQSTVAAVKKLCGAPVLQSHHSPTALRDEATGETRSLTALTGQPVAALSALANNEKFFATLQRCGARLVRKLERRDHHRWTEAEVRHLAGRAAGATALVTTEKDAVKLQAAWAAPLPLLSLRIELEFGEGAAELRKALVEVGCR